MESDFKNLTAKFWARGGGLWFFKVLINILYMYIAALSGGTLLQYVMLQQYNCLMESTFYFPLAQSTLLFRETSPLSLSPIDTKLGCHTLSCRMYFVKNMQSAWTVVSSFYYSTNAVQRKNSPQYMYFTF